MNRNRGANIKIFDSFGHPERLCRRGLVRVALLCFSIGILAGCSSGSESPDSESVAIGGSGPSGSNPPSDGPITQPSVQLSFDSGMLNVSWNDANAQSYRVLYWINSDPALNESMATGNEHAISATENGTYTLLVEAYDDLGNSVFSNPQQIEVVQ